MLFSTLGQAEIFLVTAALGLLLGLAHQVIRLLCALCKTRFAVWLWEGAFALGGLLAVLRVLWRVNGGELRGYILFALALGWGLCALLVTRWITLLQKWLRSLCQ